MTDFFPPLENKISSDCKLKVEGRGVIRKKVEKVLLAAFVYPKASEARRSRF